MTTPLSEPRTPTPEEIDALARAGHSDDTSAARDAISDAMLAERIDPMAGVRLWDVIKPWLRAGRSDARDEGLREAAKALIDTLYDYEEAGDIDLTPTLKNARLATAIRKVQVLAESGS